MLACIARMGSTFVAAVYRFHFAHGQNWDVSRRRYSARLSARLERLLAADDRLKASADGELIGLDYDPLTFSQEELAGYRLGTPVADGHDVVVPVDLWYEGQKPNTHAHDVRIRVVWERGTWRLDDVESFDTSLVRQLTEES